MPSPQLVRLSELRKIDDPDDTLSAATIAGIEASAVTDEDFKKGQLSQIKRILWGDAAGNWHDNPASFSGQDGSLNTLVQRATLEAKLILAYRINLNDVAVPASQNYVALTGSSKPDKNIAIAGTNKGAVTAQLAGAIGSHSLDEISGANPLRPKNLVAVFDASTGDAILDGSSRRIWALLQVGSAATDGNPFGDSGNDQGQLSFVVANATYTDLEACAVAAIESTSIVYAFTERNDLQSMPEESFRGDLESADPQAGVTVSLQAAYVGGYYIDTSATGNDIDFRLADTDSFVVRKLGGNALLTVNRNDGGTDNVTVGGDVDLFESKAAANDFDQGMTVDSADQTINVGITQGQIDSTALEVEATTGALNLKASGTTQDVNLEATDEVTFKTVRETTPLPLDDATAGPISTLFSQSFASISAAIAYAGTIGGVDMYFDQYDAAATFVAEANIAGVTLDLTAFTYDWNALPTTKPELFLLLNGRWLRGGNATAGQKNDWYPGTAPASGDVKVMHVVRTGDVLLTVAFKQ